MKNENGKLLSISEIQAAAIAVPVPQAYIYFLLCQGEIVHVGQSTRVWGRVDQHRTTKVFDQVSFFPASPGASAEDVDLLVAEFILKYRPKYNYAVPPNSKWLTRLQIKNALGIGLRDVSKLLKDHNIERSGDHFNFEELAEVRKILK